jgi:peptidoglycan/LPS O-acetylase OafA/YrhL
MTDQTKKIFFPNLDSLRFIAFMLVFLQHGCYNAFAPYEHSGYLWQRLISVFFQSGGTGVQIFFVLSGFLITYLILSEVQLTGRLNVGKFYMRRTLRIWPLYYATVLFAFVIYPLLKAGLGIYSDLCSTPWYYYTFLANFDKIHIALNCPGKDAMTQGIVWSVAIEEQFYLVWPLLFVVFRKYPTLVFGLVLAVCLGFRIYQINRSGGPVLYYHTLSVMGDLAIGGLAAYLVMYKDRFRYALQHLNRRVIITTYLVLFLIYFFQDKIFPGTASILVSRWLFDIFWAFIILEQNFAANSFFKLGRLHFFSQWGKYTYGLYMLHPVGILIVDILFRVAHIGTKPFLIQMLMGTGSFLLSLLIARLSYKYFEIPFLRIKERFAVIRTKTA